MTTRDKLRKEYNELILDNVDLHSSNIIDWLIEGNITYITTGGYNHIFKIEIDNLEICLKICPKSSRQIPFSVNLSEVTDKVPYIYNIFDISSKNYIDLFNKANKIKNSKFIKIAKKNIDNQENMIGILMEWCTLGDLYRPKIKLTKSILDNCLKQVYYTLIEIKIIYKDFSHNDLKPDNILLTMGENGIIALINDFDLSTSLEIAPTPPKINQIIGKNRCINYDKKFLEWHLDKLNYIKSEDKELKEIKNTKLLRCILNTNAIKKNK